MLPAALGQRDRLDLKAESMVLDGGWNLYRVFISRLTPAAAWAKAARQQGNKATVENTRY
jgi:hypothetical protein